jgi:large subunit ribosomal protein L15
MKLHDLHPAPGSRRKRTRVGRGIAAGQGKTAGRGTKGQKARAGASIPAWFEGGQTPIHIRVPKLRGFKNRFKTQYSVVNVGAISEYAAAGRFGVELEPGAKPVKGNAGDKAPATVNSEVLASAGLIGSTERPVKVLGHGDVTEKLFVAADAFSASARRKIEEAGGFVQVLAPEKPGREEPEARPMQPDEDNPPTAEASAEPEAPTTEPAPTAEPDAPTEPRESSAPETKARRKRTAKKDAEEA